MMTKKEREVVQGLFKKQSDTMIQLHKDFSKNIMKYLDNTRKEYKKLEQRITDLKKSL